MNKKEYDFTLLHVEDREDCRMIFRDYLLSYLKLNINLIQCEDVISAMNILMTERKIDFAVLDYNFPIGFNGDALTGILKSKNIPAVYYTATFKEKMNNCQFPLFQKGFDDKKLFKFLMDFIEKEFKDVESLREQKTTKLTRPSNLL